jgi:hypothetical protein
MTEDPYWPDVPWWEFRWQYVINDAWIARRLCGPVVAMSKVGKKGSALSPGVLKAQVREAFAPYLKFRAVRRAEARDFMWGYDICYGSADLPWCFVSNYGRQDGLETALIVALANIWQEWKGTSPRTVGTDTKTSRLRAGEFPFGSWVAGLFKARRLTPPSRYAIRKAIRR